ncbi:uncharacterized protein MAM_05158 [Metarhizium album ARSEF 1941]|uniref:Mmc protein n=1 Tax=Metarhizium album (strain ARSEF 1941) TaxID=1081103 RepID=A0A0B2WTR4_METAS|nr:uncharacterized protein MAM_05158 [Metarhizium album ARSEF 1941]KHN97049.1 hypothetical protein MAM_05158 [Metarhizium album ARSEF 1941]
MHTKALFVVAALATSVLGQEPATVQLGVTSKAAEYAPAPTSEHHDWPHTPSTWEKPSWSTRSHATNQTVVTRTKVVSRFTTYCPGPTTLSVGTKTYTVTAATTLTISECPCTITEVVPPPSPPNPPVHTTGGVKPPVTTGAVVAGADGLAAAYGFAMAAAGVVGAFAL